ncbi:hypothetical protein RclHR1_14580001 [Rhizophagus clarus]|uniref:Uncharacterized protein n=1 Tax=Rhizophagus clarus TaxID=94130 RepID=A0A2Z6R5H0_9GLOM|nr:hypothetical protein RclHR1_14580001 [Rhizophagus clarus]
MTNKRNTNSAQKLRNNNNNNKNNKGKSLEVKKELVKEKDRSIIDPEIVIISELDKQIVNNTYGDTNKDRLIIFVQTVALNVTKTSDLKANDTTNKNKNNISSQHTKSSTPHKIHKESKAEDELSSKHKKYLQDLMNAALNNIKDQLVNQMSQIKEQVFSFNAEIQEFYESCNIHYLDKWENTNINQNKTTNDSKKIHKDSDDSSFSSEEEKINDLILKHQNLDLKLDSVTGTINTMLNNFFNTIIKGEHNQYELVELEGEGETDYKGNDDDEVIDQ